MKLKNKELEAEAKIIHKKILAKDEARFNAFCAKKYGPQESIDKPKMQWIRKMAIGLASASIILITLVSTLLVVYLPNKGDVVEPTKQYFSENEVQRDNVQSIEVLADMQCLILNLDSQNDVDITLIYDSMSNDNLYFIININDEENFLMANVFVVTNALYNLHFSMPLDFKTTEIYSFNVKYGETFSLIEDYGLYKIDSTMVIETEHEVLYIEYSSYSLDENASGLDWLSQIISRKE